MRIAVVTGASSGLGREFAVQVSTCYRNLDEIWLVARSTDKLKSLKKSLEKEGRVMCRIFDGDLLRDYIYTRINRAFDKEQPDIRMLVNAAGLGRLGDVAELEGAIQEEMVDLNCKALTKMVKLCLPYLSDGSRIVNLASAAAFAPQPGFAVYAASKAYVLSYSKALSKELKGRGIVVTAVCPGPVDTPFFEEGDRINKLKEKIMAEPEAVVEQALLDTRKRKQISIYGMTMKGTKLASKILPDGVVLKAMEIISKN